MIKITYMIDHENNNQKLTPNEVAEMQKEMHMVGRAMRVDETLEQYNQEREESWQKTIAEKSLKESEDLERTRQLIAGNPEKDRGDVFNFEKYKDLPNVKLCEEKLLDRLKNHVDYANFVDRVAGDIRDMLTQRSEFVGNTYAAGVEVADHMAAYSEQKSWYRHVREILEKVFIESPEFSWESNPGWFGINTRPDIQDRDTNSMKIYTTIPIDEYAFIRHMPQLTKTLRRLSQESDDIIKVKIPESFTGFLSHNDSIVVHFKNTENTEKIMDAITAWMKENNIHEQPREMDRTRVAADMQGTSFSELVAQNIARWLEQNRGKYEDGVLAREAIKYAIIQSQKSPV